MADVRDRVRMLPSEAGFLVTNVLQSQPHRKGVVTIDNGDGTRGVLFVDTGEFLDNIPDGSLEVLDNVDAATIEDFYFTVVRPAGADASQEYTGKIVDLYIASGTLRALIKTPSGLFYEQLLTQLVRVDFDGVPQ